jgi:hypothetical protein
MSKHILSSATSYEIQGIHSADIDEHTENVLQTIDSEIKTKNNNRENHLQFEMPTVFTEERNDETKLIVYYNVLQELEKQGYKVIFTEEDNGQSFFHISWNSMYDLKTLQTMKCDLEKHKPQLHKKHHHKT